MVNRASRNAATTAPRSPTTCGCCSTPCTSSASTWSAPRSAASSPRPSPRTGLSAPVDSCCSPPAAGRCRRATSEPAGEAAFDFRNAILALQRSDRPGIAVHDCVGTRRRPRWTPSSCAGSDVTLRNPGPRLARDPGPGPEPARPAGRPATDSCADAADLGWQGQSVRRAGPLLVAEGLAPGRGPAVRGARPQRLLGGSAGRRVRDQSVSRREVTRGPRGVSTAAAGRRVALRHAEAAARRSEAARSGRDSTSKSAAAT